MLAVHSVTIAIMARSGEPPAGWQMLVQAYSY